MKELALIICSKKPYRTLEEFALTLAEIPPLPTYPQQALEDAERRRLYLYNLTELQRAVSVGALQASQHKFSDNPKEYVCSFEDFLVWSKANRPELYAEYQAIKTNDVDIGLDGETVPVKQNEEPKPWLVADPKDPNPKYFWYTPARYFARQLVIGDATLLTKRSLLANKVVHSLTNADFKKRGGKKPFDPNTILKAFTNVILG